MERSFDFHAPSRKNEWAPFHFNFNFFLFVSVFKSAKYLDSVLATGSMRMCIFLVCLILYHLANKVMLGCCFLLTLFLVMLKFLVPLNFGVILFIINVII